MDFDGETASLIINDVEEPDVATYKCILYSPEGSIETDANLTILTNSSPEQIITLPFQENLDPKPPLISLSLPKLLEISEGCEVKLNVRAEGTLPLDVIWMKDGCVLPNCEDFRQEEDGKGNVALWIPDAFPEDAGDYRCEIYNKFGEAMSKCKIIVKGNFVYINNIL